MKTNLLLPFAVVVGAIGTLVVALATNSDGSVQAVAPITRLHDEGPFPPLAGATEWLNSPALTASDLRGKVVLVDFWTYTCINWLRTAPYIRAWAEKYKDDGLVVIGVHSPEFDFEKDIANVRRAVSELRIGFPVAVDSDHEVWRAFRNRYWPAVYLIGADGRIRYHQFGEGGYAESERAIQLLLAEAGATSVPRDLVAVSGVGIQAGPDWDNLRSPENYLGLDRTQGFASTGGSRWDSAPRIHEAPAQLRLNQWALVGDWKLQADSVALRAAAGRIVYRFQARDLHLVLKPTLTGHPVRFQVRLDGEPPGASHGADVDEQGNGTVIEPRLYQLIRQPGIIDDRLFEIEFLGAGVEAYAFTFG